MTETFFDRLEADLAQATRDGAHLDRASRRHRVLVLVRHSCSVVAVSVVVATSLISGFPASANGMAVAGHTAPTPILRSL